MAAKKDLYNTNGQNKRYRSIFLLSIFRIRIGDGKKVAYISYYFKLEVYSNDLVAKAAR